MNDNGGVEGATVEEADGGDSSVDDVAGDDEEDASMAYFSFHFKPIKKKAHVKTPAELEAEKKAKE